MDITLDSAIGLLYYPLLVLIPITIDQTFIFWDNEWVNNTFYREDKA